MNEYRKAVSYISSLSKDLGLFNITFPIINNVRFNIWSGSSHPNCHHYGRHGLIIHTSEVIRLAIANNKLLNVGLSEREIFLAALFHDYGKIYDYALNSNGEWYSVPHKYMVHHISRSAAYWQMQSEKFRGSLRGIDSEGILHAILSHHGNKLYGSPVEPQTKLAWLIHLCDSISARMHDSK